MINRVIFWKPDYFNLTTSKLKEVLEHKIKVINKGNKISKVTPRPTDLVINWGNSKFNSWEQLETSQAIIINNPAAVEKACNKINALTTFDKNGIHTVAYTTTKTVAETWFKQGNIIIARHLIKGNSGKGIVICKPEETKELPDAPLYTVYKKKRYEYRVHVFNGEIIDVTQKKINKDKINKNNPNLGMIRNIDDGWVFCHNDIVPIKAGTKLLCKEAVDALGLTFGAVDLIYNEHEDKYYVLEVNTAPGLSNTKTLEAYQQAIISYVNKGDNHVY
jgi:glutathione synthase/RimK-type ligase-like ATP-grasp enzyme